MKLPEPAEDILRDGILCYLAASTGRGPHCTPVVFVLDGGTIWATTRRGAVKARGWRARPEAAGLVRAGDRAVSFRGPVSLHDLLDPDTWGRSLMRAPGLARASARFMLKNARFFAGYARDAGRMPLSWTPPARIAVGTEPVHGAVIAGGGVLRAWGSWGDRVSSQERYRVSKPGELSIPGEVRPGAEGEGVLALEGAIGPVTLPVSWRRRGGAYLCVLPEEALALAAAPAETRGALVVDRASRWRASRMRGVMLQGLAESFLGPSLRSGATALARDGSPGKGDAVVRLFPERATWWRGWTTGTVGRA